MCFRYSIFYVDDVFVMFVFYEKVFGFEIGFLYEGKDYGELIIGDMKFVFFVKFLMCEIGKLLLDVDFKVFCFELVFEIEIVVEDFVCVVVVGVVLI